MNQPQPDTQPEPQPQPGPPSLTRDMRAAIVSSWEFLKLKATGAALFDDSAATARRSLWAMPLSLPILWLAIAMSSSFESEAFLPWNKLPWPFVLALSAAVHALIWYLFLWLVRWPIRWLEREEHYAHYVTVYNWTGFGQMLLIFLPGRILATAMGGSVDAVMLVLMVVSIVLIAQRCIINSITLRVGGLPAAVLTIGELVVTELIAAAQNTVLFSAIEAWSK